MLMASLIHPRQVKQKNASKVKKEIEVGTESNKSELCPVQIKHKISIIDRKHSNYRLKKCQI